VGFRSQAEGHPAADARRIIEGGARAPVSRCPRS